VGERERLKLEGKGKTVFGRCKGGKKKGRCFCSAKKKRSSTCRGVPLFGLRGVWGRCFWPYGEKKKNRILGAEKSAAWRLGSLGEEKEGSALRERRRKREILACERGGAQAKGKGGGEYLVGEGGPGKTVF